MPTVPAIPLSQCPRCHSDGPIGALCGQPACRVHAYHCVPHAHMPKADASAEDAANVGRLIGGRYLVVGVLGTGSFGKVLHVLQKPLWRPAALKLMDLRGAARDDSERFVEQFRREAEALAMLDHENIVRLIDYDDDDGTGSAFMVMELVLGRNTLRSEMRSRSRAGASFEPGEVTRWISQILSALSVAHNHPKCIVHRDLKPDNVMLVAGSDGEVSVKIVDFGLAKFTAEGDRTRGAVGTLRYMAPEQLRAADIGPAADLYAVACIALELMTGRSMFSLGSEAQIMEAKRDPLHDPLSPLSDLALPPAVLQLFRRALAFDPAQRLTRAEEFRTQFLALVKSLPSEEDAESRLSSSVDVSSAPLISPVAANRRTSPPRPIHIANSEVLVRTAAPPALVATQIWAACVVIVVICGLFVSGP